jgi:molybdenum cofactor sulfurtransferase
MSRGAQFYCSSLDDLKNASRAWFQKLTEHSAECEENAVYEEKKLPDTSPNSETFVHAAPKTIWVHHLLVLPVECNFGGDRFDWSSTVSAARNSTYATRITFKSVHSDSDVSAIRICHKWHVLLDTAKAAATSEVNLATMVPSGPDFAIVSFYKMFGSPTGLGALFIKKQQYNEAKKQRTDVNKNSDDDLDVTIDRQPNVRHYFGGGSVDIVLPHVDFTVPRNSRTKSSEYTASIESKYYDDGSLDSSRLTHGTQHFRGIVELTHGFQELRNLGGMSKVSNHHVLITATNVIVNISTSDPDIITFNMSCSRTCTPIQKLVP